jgi:tetratricopeptide (TPR) repeat protein
MNRRWRFAPGLCFLLSVSLLSPACRKDRVELLQPLGPTVQLPPTVVFRGERPPEIAAIPSPGQPPRTAAPIAKKVTPDVVQRIETELAQHPNDAETQSDAGAIFAADGNVERGVDLLAKARANAPDNPSIAFNYAHALYQQGNTDEAMNQADAALRLQPEFDEARMLEAGISIQKNDYDRAEQQILTILNKVSVIVRIIRGIIELKRGHLDAALNIFQELVTTEPQNSVALYDLGVAQQYKKNYPEAERLYSQALQQDPDMAEAHNNLGTLLAYRGESEKAFEQFHAASLQKPNDQNIAANLSSTAREGVKTEDILVGVWISDGGSGQIRGTFNGQYTTQAIPVRTGDEFKVSKVGNGEYRIEIPEGSTTVRLGSNGSYQGQPVGTPDFPQGVSATGTVSFWVHGNVMYGDTTESASGSGVTMQMALHWKAHRSTSG